MQDSASYHQIAASCTVYLKQHSSKEDKKCHGDVFTVFHMPGSRTEGFQMPSAAYKAEKEEETVPWTPVISGILLCSPF